MAPAHRPAVLSLFLSCAFLPGGSPGAIHSDHGEGLARCPGLARDSAHRAGEEQLKLAGYKLLQAGRVDDAIAFFQLNVAGHRSAEVARMSR